MTTMITFNELRQIKDMGCPQGVCKKLRTNWDST